MIDTHIHLDQLPDAAAQLEEARGLGVEAFIAVGVDEKTSALALDWARGNAFVWAGVGHHPLNRTGPDLARLRALCQDPRVVAVGEVGLDAQDPERGPEAAQREWFDSCCDLALEMSLPVCVHIRETAQDVYDVLAGHPGLGGVIHYWSLGWEWAERFLELGFHLSFSGVATRATQQQVREVARRMPPERLLLETDAPWGLSRGRSGSMRAAWILDTRQVIAEERQLSGPELDELEWGNALRLFSRLRR